VTERCYAPVPNAILQHASLSDGAVRLYAILLGWRPERDGTVIATYQQLGQAAGHHRNWAVARVRELGAAGVLIWQRGGRGRPNRYELLDVVPRSRPKAREIRVEVPEQPRPEALHLDRVGGAELGDAAGVGDSPAAVYGAGRLAGAPDLMPSVDRVERIHTANRPTVSGVSDTAEADRR
jgi:hypothetical protein